MNCVKPIMSALAVGTFALGAYTALRGPEGAPIVLPPAEAALTQMPQYTGSCIRSDIPDIMPNIRVAGFDMVRIAGSWESLMDPDSQFRRALDAAKRNDLTPLIVLAPDFEVQQTDIDAMVGMLESYYGFGKGYIVEVGNEVDVQGYWMRVETSEDLGQIGLYADFFKRVFDAYQQINPQREIIVGSLWETKLQRKLLYELAIRNVPIGALPYAFHAYNSKAEIAGRFDEVKGALDEYLVPRRIFMTEAGYPLDQQGNGLLSLIKFARQSDVGLPICAHEANPYSEWTIERHFWPSLASAMETKP